MEIFIIKWALTEGVIVVNLDLDGCGDGQVSDGALEVFRYDEDATSMRFGPGDWADSEEDAHRLVLAKIAKKSKALRDRAGRLDRIAERTTRNPTFPVRMQDVAKSKNWERAGLGGVPPVAADPNRF